MYSLELNRLVSVPPVRRNQSFAVVVSGRNQAGILFVSQR